MFQDTPTPCDGTLRVGMGNLKSRKPTSIPKTENGKTREENQVICLQVFAAILSVINEKLSDFIFYFEDWLVSSGMGVGRGHCTVNAVENVEMNPENIDNVIFKRSRSIGMRWEH